MKKQSERRKHCALAVARRSPKFSPRRRPLPGGAGRPKFKQLETVATFTYRHKRTKPQTNRQTDRIDYNTLRR